MKKTGVDIIGEVSKSFLLLSPERSIEAFNNSSERKKYD